MPRYIVKLNDGNRDYYLEWSTVVDAPVTFGVSLEEFKQGYQEQYGTEGMRALAERLVRVEKKGTSDLLHGSVDELLQFNRAGKGETCLTKEQIIDAYCVNTDWAVCKTDEEYQQGKQCPIVGTKPWEHEND
jgi:hypothetical protein